MEGWVVAHNIENGVNKDYAVIVKSKKKYIFFIIVSHLQWKAMLSVTILKLLIVCINSLNLNSFDLNNAVMFNSRNLYF